MASTKTFGDPCQGTVKYLEVQYQCIPGKSTVLLYQNNFNANLNNIPFQADLSLWHAEFVIKSKTKAA